MAYNDALAQRLRQALSHRNDLQEEDMHGGLAFKVSNHKCIGVINDDLMTRVPPDEYKALLKKPHTKVLNMFGGIPLPGFIMVEPVGIETEENLNVWVEICETYADSLPPK